MAVRHGVLAWLVASGVALLAFPFNAAAEGDVMVLELFTSQNCSHCPEADALANDLAQRDGVLLLSFPVDYWNHLGRKDALAQADFTLRQEAHADSLGIRHVYTPQLVVDGEAHAVASHRHAVEEVIQHRKGQNRPLETRMRREDDTLMISVAKREGAELSAAPADILLVRYVKEYVIAPDDDDDNQERHAVYTNAVRDLSPIGRWQGDDMSIILPLVARAQRHDGVAVLIQEKASGKIIGAAQLALD